MRKTDKILLILWIIIPPAILLALHGNFFISTILYFIFPGIYFSFRKPKIIPKALTAAIATIPFVIFCDYLAFFNNAWEVPTIFNFRFFGSVPLEDFFFTFFSVYLIIAAFHYFFRPANFERLDNFRLTVFFVCAAIAVAIFAVLENSGLFLLRIPYYDFSLVVLVFFLPALTLFIMFPGYRKSFLPIISYSFVLMLPYELVALHLNFWSFPSNEYIAVFRIWNLRFPLEEMLEWMVLFAPAVLFFSELIMGKAKTPPGEA